MPHRSQTYCRGEPEAEGAESMPAPDEGRGPAEVPVAGGSERAPPSISFSQLNSEKSDIEEELGDVE